jgi:hypothetical protein
MLHLGGEAEVLEPQALREALRAAGARMAALNAQRRRSPSASNRSASARR